LVRPDGAKRHFGGSLAATIEGEHCQSLLFLSGRTDTAHVTLGEFAEAKGALESSG
jgi:hypothetical protein